jgi:hypothetical protein
MNVNELKQVLTLPSCDVSIFQYFRTLNTRVSVVYIETWQGTNQAPIDKSDDISRALLDFNDYTSRNLFSMGRDTTQLLTWVHNVVHSFHWHVQNVTIPCCSQELLALLSVMYVSCHSSPPHILPSSLTLSCHLFLGLPLSLVKQTLKNKQVLHVIYTKYIEKETW